MVWRDLVRGVRRSESGHRRLPTPPAARHRPATRPANIAEGIAHHRHSHQRNHQPGSTPAERSLRFAVAVDKPFGLRPVTRSLPTPLDGGIEHGDSRSALSPRHCRVGTQPRYSGRIDEPYRHRPTQTATTPKVPCYSSLVGRLSFDRLNSMADTELKSLKRVSNPDALPSPSTPRIVRTSWKVRSGHRSFHVFCRCGYGETSPSTARYERCHGSSSDRPRQV